MNKEVEGAPLLRGVCEGAGERPHRNTKRTGELSEAAFLLKAESLGFHLSRPWGDSERYDFILDSGRRCWRVQLKCTEVVRARGYDIQPIYAIYGQGKVVYTPDDIDVLVAHIIPRDTFYILPVEDFFPCKSLRFYPDVDCKRARWEQYREAWHLLRDHESGLCPGLGDWRRCHAHGISARTTEPEGAPS